MMRLNDPYKVWSDPEPSLGRDRFGRILPRSEIGGWDALPESFKAPNRGKSFHFRRKRLIRCWRCRSLFEGWGRSRYCSRRCLRKAKIARRCERFGGHEPGTLYTRLPHPDALLLPRRKRPQVFDRDGWKTPEHAGLELGVPISCIS